LVEADGGSMEMNSPESESKVHKVGGINFNTKSMRRIALHTNKRLELIFSHRAGICASTVLYTFIFSRAILWDGKSGASIVAHCHSRRLALFLPANFEYQFNTHTLTTALMECKQTAFYWADTASARSPWKQYFNTIQHQVWQDEKAGK